uniref:Exosome-associated factor Rrp6 N-terminal domain-containing protein n=1 Tax=Plectus sambesii TaxID=2011161 RepID=A0A914XKM8_9BILA
MASNTPPDAKALSKSVNVAVARAIKSANGLPKIGDNFELVASYPAFSQLMDAERVRMIELLKRLLRHGNCKTKIPSPIRDNDEFFDRLIEANDSILERVGNLLDEAEGIRKPEDVAVPVSTEDFAESTTASSKTQFKIPLTQSRKAGQQRKAVATLPSASGSKILKKPQVQYSIPVDNSAAPFVPKLKIKHHSRPRKSGNVTIADDTNSGREWLSDENESMHPYQYELDYYEPPAAQLELGTITDPLPVEETPLVYVDNVEKLTELRDILNKEKEFAVDVEHHDYRSFLGLTGRVQISTRTVDYIIDPFPIWQHMHI